MTVPCTVVSCVYGDTHDKFIPEWLESVRELDPQPAEVIVATDFPPRGFDFPEVYAFASECNWQHPQAFFLNQAIMAANTEWAWILDIDDTAEPNALEGIDAVEADVWQMGYIRDDGEKHIPPDVPDLHSNQFTAGSAIRRDAFEEAGGFRDKAFQDWDLWCRLVLFGNTFESSGRVHYRYRLHDGSRTRTELLPERRAEHIEEMHA